LCLCGNLQSRTSTLSKIPVEMFPFGGSGTCCLDEQVKCKEQWMKDALMPPILISL
jgi:hypothetical protein